MNLALLSEESAARNGLGHEGLKLLRELAANEFHMEPEWQEKCRQLIEVWKINSDTEFLRIREHTLKLRESQRVKCKIDGQEVEFSNITQLLEWEPVKKATQDSDKKFFRRMIIRDGKLYAERCTRTKSGATDPERHYVCDIENGHIFRITVEKSSPASDEDGRD